jgi:hypothetical protein
VFLPDGNMAAYGDHWEATVRPDLSKLDWAKIGKVRAVDLDGPLPKRSRPPRPFDEKQESILRNFCSAENLPGQIFISAKHTVFSKNERKKYIFHNNRHES